MIFQIVSILLLIFGFGFVIFWHELGHFLAAKAVGIKVEQFAVGFGQALVSWRKGLGVQFGSSGKRYEELTRNGAADGISETEYRLNWIPLGGYVKMLGQDDLRPNAQQDDPRAYSKKSIGARMLVVSAGVIMNIILAAIGFMVVFLMGFRAPPAVVGSILPGSPASETVKLVDGQSVPAPLQVGDRILYFDDKYQHDFTKITLNVALAEPGVAVPLYVERTDGTREHLTVFPERMGRDPSSFLGLGIGQPFELRGVEQHIYEATRDALVARGENPDTLLALKPGEKVTHVNGVSLADGPDDKEPWKNYHKFHQALQDAAGKPVTLTAVNEAGESRDFEVRPVLPQGMFGDQPLHFAGLMPRQVVDQVQPGSAAEGKLKSGDVFVALKLPNGKVVENPTWTELTDTLNQAGQGGQAIDITVLRGDERVTATGITPNITVGKDAAGNNRKGLGVALRPEDALTFTAGTADKSAAATAGIPKGALIRSVNGKPVTNWFEVARELSSAEAGQPVQLAADTGDGAEKQFTIELTEPQRLEVASVEATHEIALHDRAEPRKTDNPLTAAGWGVVETRDFVLQFYLTLQRMFTGDVSYKNMMGPVGIVHAGAKFAFKGTDWLIWFLSMISANLAVVNFLPIPIVDGGLFLFLIIEKIQGRPLSAKTQSIAQVVGLAVILSVFLLVTYQDIARLL